MRTASRIMTLLVAGILGTLFACSDSAQPIATKDKIINDTTGEDVSAPQPMTPPADAGADADAADRYGPSVVACASCSCDPTKNYCFSGGSQMVVVVDSGSGADDSGDNDSGAGTADAAHLPEIPFAGSGGGFGEPDGAADTGPPPPPCTLLPAGSATAGCTPLPASCAATPTCECLLAALQPQYPSCYLVCTPTPGFLSVYCGG